MVSTHCFDPSEEAEDDRTSASELGFSPVPTPAMSQAMLPSLSPTVNTLTTQFQTAPFLQDMQGRSQAYGSPAMLQPDLAAEQYGYPTVSGPKPLQMHNTLVSPHHHPLGHPAHETARRASLFTPPTTTAAWSHSPPPPPQASPVTTTAAASPEPSPLFTFAATHHHHQPQHQQHQQQQQHTILPPPTALGLPLLMTHHHHQQAAGAYAAAAAAQAQAQYAHGPFDAMAHQYHQQNNTVFRGGSIQLTLQPHHQGFGGFGHHHEGGPGAQGH